MKQLLYIIFIFSFLLILSSCGQSDMEDTQKSASEGTFTSVQNINIPEWDQIKQSLSPKNAEKQEIKELTWQINIFK